MWCQGDRLAESTRPRSRLAYFVCASPRACRRGRSLVVRGFRLPGARASLPEWVTADACPEAALGS